MEFDERLNSFTQSLKASSDDGFSISYNVVDIEEKLKFDMKDFDHHFWLIYDT